MEHIDANFFKLLCQINTMIDSITIIHVFDRRYAHDEWHFLWHNTFNRLNHFDSKLC